jgi:hypothetical protein
MWLTWQNENVNASQKYQVGRFVLTLFAVSANEGQAQKREELRWEKQKLNPLIRDIVASHYNDEYSIFIVLLDAGLNPH